MGRSARLANPGGLTVSVNASGTGPTAAGEPVPSTPTAAAPASAPPKVPSKEEVGGGSPSGVLPQLPEPALPPVQELILSLPQVISALSLTSEGAEAVRLHDPFPALLAVFCSPSHSLPASRCLQGEVPTVVGQSLDEIMRHHVSAGAGIRPVPEFKDTPIVRLPVRLLSHRPAAQLDTYFPRSPRCNRRASQPSPRPFDTWRTATTSTARTSPELGST